MLQNALRVGTWSIRPPFSAGTRRHPEPAPAAITEALHHRQKETHELGSHRRKLEAGEGQSETTVGQAHRRRARPDRGPARAAGRQDPALLRHRQGRGREAAKGMGIAPARLRALTGTHRAGRRRAASWVRRFSVWVWGQSPNFVSSWFRALTPNFFTCRTAEPRSSREPWCGCRYAGAALSCA